MVGAPREKNNGTASPVFPVSAMHETEKYA